MKRVLLVLAALSVAALCFAGGGGEAQPERLGQVPRERTLISSGWDWYAQVPSPDNMNPYVGTLRHLRNILHYTVFENLFYSNILGGTVEPWIAKEEWSYNGDFTQVTVNIRDDVYWSDGVKLTAKDIVFTGNMLLQNAPQLGYASQFKSDVARVEAVGDYTIVFHLNKPAPRWARDELTYALGQPSRFVIVPEHIWKDKNPLDFTNLDLGKGWPIGTGPFKLVRNSSDQLVFDRLDNWWADKAGKQTRPEVERIIYRPATAEAHPQLYISNQLDVGRDIPRGAFEAGRMQNPKLVSWNASGPQWGAPNGCTYRLTFNNQRAPFNDRDLRWAVNYALDRKKIIELAYEGATYTAIAPLSAYDEIKIYVNQLSSVFKKYDVDNQNFDKVAQLMQSKGYSKNQAGFWVNADGVLELDIQSQQGNPMGPIIAQQLRDAGFDARIDILQDAAFVDNASKGNFDLHLWVHCGSVYDPYQTLEHYHSSYAVAPGQPVSNVRAYTRYANPELDVILDRMRMMVPSPKDPVYLDLAAQAIEIYLRDLPVITLGEERQVFTMNTTYWTGWPSASNNYMHPTPPWEGFARVIHKLKAVK